MVLGVGEAVVGEELGFVDEMMNESVFRGWDSAEVSLARRALYWIESGSDDGGDARTENIVLDLNLQWV